MNKVCFYVLCGIWGCFSSVFAGIDDPFYCVNVKRSLIQAYRQSDAVAIKSIVSRYKNFLRKKGLTKNQIEENVKSLDLSVKKFLSRARNKKILSYSILGASLCGAMCGAIFVTQYWANLNIRPASRNTYTCDLGDGKKVEAKFGKSFKQRDGCSCWIYATVHHALDVCDGWNDKSKLKKARDTIDQIRASRTHQTGYYGTPNIINAVIENNEWLRSILWNEPVGNEKWGKVKDSCEHCILLTRSSIDGGIDAVGHYISLKISKEEKGSNEIVQIVVRDSLGADTDPFKKYFFNRESVVKTAARRFFEKINQ